MFVVALWVKKGLKDTILLKAHSRLNCNERTEHGRYANEKQIHMQSWK